MAYIRSLERKCRCGKRAVVEVIDRFNSSRGEFCRSCGARRLRELQKQEAESFETVATSGAAR